METAPRSAACEKRLAAEEEEKDAQPVLALLDRRREKIWRHPLQRQERGKVELEELLRARFRILIVEAPLPAVREHAPFDPAIGEHGGAAEIAQHLCRGNVVLSLACAVGLVERAEPSLVLDDDDAVPVTIALDRLGVRPALVLLFGEEEHVGNIPSPAPRGTRLRQVVRARPAERLEDGEEEILFGLRLVGRAFQRKRLVDG